MTVVLVVLAFVRHEAVVLSDDAYISFRYSDNLAAGRGLVFNEGERVEGYSNLLWTLLLAGGRMCGVAPVLGAQLLGALSGALTLLVVPSLARCLGATPAGALGASLALGLSATFSSWMLRGLEGPLFTLLLVLGTLALTRDVSGGRGLGMAIGSFGALGITRPEGPLFVVAATAVLLLDARRDRKRQWLFLATSGVWASQIVFRLAYYGDYVPNSYRAKVWAGADRWGAGIDYALGFAKSCGPLLPLLVAGVVASAWRAMSATGHRLCVILCAVSLFFCVGSGGDGFVHWRFFQPFLALALALAAAAIPGPAGRALLLVLPLAVVFSGQGEIARRTFCDVVSGGIRGDRGVSEWLRQRARLLSEHEDLATYRLGAWLQENAAAGSLLAIDDCGMVPYVSGLRTLDTAGLMDKHIAGVPGRSLQKVDLSYVVSRQPDTIVLHLNGFSMGLPYDRRMAIYRPFLDSYRLVRVEPVGSKTAYYVFRRIAPPVLPPIAVDLMSWFPAARAIVEAADGPRRAGKAVQLSSRFVDMPSGELAALDALVPRSSAPVSPDRVAALDAAFRALAERSREGILVTLDPQVSGATISYASVSCPPRSRLVYAVAYLPWTPAPAPVEVAAETLSGGRTERGMSSSGTVDVPLGVEGGPVSITFRVRRPAGVDPGLRLDVLLESPRLVVADLP
ncbi:MAG: hypothetical protein U0166_04295 [Acidobacteriota bacterium]